MWISSPTPVTTSVIVLDSGSSSMLTSSARPALGTSIQFHTGLRSERAVSSSSCSVAQPQIDSASAPSIAAHATSGASPEGPEALGSRLRALNVRRWSAPQIALPISGSSGIHQSKAVLSRMRLALHFLSGVDVDALLEAVQRDHQREPDRSL